MTRLSVNVNKIATLRNARGHNLPDLLQVVKDCERFGAEGITVHPRPDERHIRYQDVRDIKKIITTEFNIEGNPKEQKFIDLVLEVKPDQVTLVPDNSDQLTSDHGWDTIKERDFLVQTINLFKTAGIRTSIFLDPNPELISSAKETGADRIELYTESYCKLFRNSKELAVAPFVETAKKADSAGLGINAGHDLNLENLRFLKVKLPKLLEVSIGHALICDAIYLGLENTIQLYLKELKN